jgi:glycosyltransferase involved in cell wall biosynthesis
MKVLVVNNAVPFVRGGAEELADNLVSALGATRGVQAELMRIPFKWTPSERLIEEILIHRQLRLWNVDRVIALKFPAYLIPHEEKVLWILHQFRQAYDLGDAGQGLGDDGRDGQIKAAIREADNQCFRQARTLLVNSPVTQGRLARYNGFASEVLYPPLNDEALFTGGEDGGYVFAGGRVGPGKRQHLLIEAMAQVPGSGRLVIAGPPDTSAYASQLESLAADLGLQNRVSLEFGFHPRRRIAEWVNGARACAYLPFDEDSLGYVTMEAFAAGKPVLTTTDSGGLLEMVGEATGHVAPPEPEAIAKGLALFLERPARAAELGRAAQADWRRRNLTWPATVQRLLA